MNQRYSLLEIIITMRKEQNLVFEKDMILSHLLLKIIIIYVKNWKKLNEFSLFIINNNNNVKNLKKFLMNLVYLLLIIIIIYVKIEKIF